MVTAQEDELPPAHVPSIRVFLLADVLLFREGLRHALERQARLDIVGSAGSVAEAVTQITSSQADVVLIDTGMREGLATARELCTALPDVKLIGLALVEAEAEVIAWAEAGIAAYVTRDASLSELVRAIERAMRGEVICSPLMAGSLMRRLAARANQDRSRARHVPLTSRESDIARLIARGLSNKEIARTLSISLPTVKNHVHNILEKMQVKRRTQAAYVIRREYVSPDR